jgi:hypothetical protein
MAKQTIVTYHSDLSGADGAQTVKFGYGGRNYEIDLTAEEDAALAGFLEKYIEKGTRVAASNYSSSSGGSTGAARRQYGTGPARRDTKHIREWIRNHGGEISDRGRIPDDLLTAFETETPLPEWKNNRRRVSPAEEARIVAARTEAIPLPEPTTAADVQEILTEEPPKEEKPKAAPAAKKAAAKPRTPSRRGKSTTTV